MIQAVDHIGIAVRSIAEARRFYEAMGVDVLRQEPSPGAEGAKVQFVHPRSSGGVLVELSEPVAK